MADSFKTLDDVSNICFACYKDPNNKIHVMLSESAYFKDLLDNAPDDLTDEEKGDYNIRDKVYDSEEEALKDCNENIDTFWP